MLDRLVTALGILLALGGECFRLLVIGYAYIKRGGKNGRVWADKLVVKGFYAHTRNPMYAGNFLIIVGVTMIYGSPWAYFIVIPFFIFVYLSIVEAEEECLGREFGEQYVDYTNRVHRFLPQFRGIQESLREFQYDWWRAIRKDYGTIFGLSCGIIFIIAWKAYCSFGFSERKTEILACALLCIPPMIFYVIVRTIVKARGRFSVATSALSQYVGILFCVKENKVAPKFDIETEQAWRKDLTRRLGQIEDEINHFPFKKRVKILEDLKLSYTRGGMDCFMRTFEYQTYEAIVNKEILAVEKRAERMGLQFSELGFTIQLKGKKLNLVPQGP